MAKSKGSKRQMIIKTAAKEQKPDKTHAALPLLIAGSFALLMFLSQTEVVIFSPIVVYPAVLVLCTALHFMWKKSKWLVFGVSISLTVLLGLMLVLNRDVIRNQAMALYWIIRGSGDAPIDMTGTVLILSLLMTLGMFGLEVAGKSHALLYLLTTALLLISPLFGVKVNEITALLFLLYQLVFWVFRIAEARKGRELSFSDNKSALLQRCGIVTAVLTAAAFVLALPAVSFFTEQMYNVIFATEGLLTTAVRGLAGVLSQPVTGGTVNRGNVYRTGARHLELTAERQPTENIYLRGFCGKEYLGGEWSEGDMSDLGDTSLLIDYYGEEGEPTLTFSWDSLSEDDYLYLADMVNMYYHLNQHTTAEPEPNSLNIKHVSGDYSTYFMPYNMSAYNDIDGSSLSFDNVEGYSVYFYQPGQMNITADNIKSDFQNIANIYSIAEENYISRLDYKYLYVPRDRLPRLTQLVEENPLTELNDITAFIIYTLQSNAKYSLTPGWTPFNEDVAEYFLFESKRGYCEHFATVAALMYRMYGVPARYVTGYLVQPSAFSEDEGGWHGYATDEDAHAWVEIFLPNQGWTPIEVTPSSDGLPMVTYPGFDTGILGQLLREHGWNIEEPSLGGAAESESGEGGGDTDDGGTNTGGDFVLAAALIIIAGAAAVLLIIVPLRRRILLRRLSRSSTRAAFGRFTAMLEYCGISTDIGDTELARVIGAKFPDVPDPQGLIDTVSRCAYSAHPDEQPELVLSAYLAAAKRLAAELSPPKKLIFKYIKAFC